MKDCSDSIGNTLLLQSCTKPSICACGTMYEFWTRIALCSVFVVSNISKVKCGTAVYPLLTQWRYCRLAPSHRCYNMITVFSPASMESHSHSTDSSLPSTDPSLLAILLLVPHNHNHDYIVPLVTHLTNKVFIRYLFLLHLKLFDFLQLNMIYESPYIYMYIP